MRLFIKCYSLAKKSFNFYGNFMFASKAQIQGKIAQPEDDLESLVYLLCYILNNDKLPWSFILDKDAR